MTSRRDFLRHSGMAAVATRLRAQGQAGDPPMMIEHLVAANHILASQGVFDAYGHVSMRNPVNTLRYFMTRSLAAELVQAEDILEFDLDSNIAGPKKAAM